MGTYSNPQLEDMGLTPYRHGVDERFGWGQWPKREVLHAAILATDQPNKPTSNPLWRTAAGANLVTAVKCNMGIHIIKLSAVIPGGNANGTDKALPPEYYICKKETGVWTLKYVTTSEGDHKSNSHLKQASNKENYSVTEYNNYIPTEVRDASNEYKDLYYTEYRPANYDRYYIQQLQM
jgi:hypothetical protein